MIRIDLVLNNKCNFNCSYCCGGLSSQQSNDYVLPINISRLVYYLNKKLPKNSIEFNLLGGEPLLYKDLPSIYEILSKSKHYTKIRIDTNGSNIISDKLIYSIESCLKNSKISIEVYLTYHFEILNTHNKFLNNYYSNIKLLLKHKIPTIIRLLYNNDTFFKINDIKEELSQKFPQLLFEWRKIFNIKQTYLFLHDYYCFANNFIGIFPNNRLFYNCEYEIEGNNVKNYEFTKDNIQMFIKNFNIKRRIIECRSVYSCPSKLYLNLHNIINLQNSKYILYKK